MISCAASKPWPIRRAKPTRRSSGSSSSSASMKRKSARASFAKPRAHPGARRLRAKGRSLQERRGTQGLCAGVQGDRGVGLSPQPPLRRGAKPLAATLVSSTSSALTTRNLPCPTPNPSPALPRPMPSQEKAPLPKGGAEGGGIKEPRDFSRGS
jgi:hypothetical protein